MLINIGMGFLAPRGERAQSAGMYAAGQRTNSKVDRSRNPQSSTRAATILLRCNPREAASPRGNRFLSYHGSGELPSGPRATLLSRNRRARATLGPAIPLA